MFSHTGTHIDAPAHLFADGRTLDGYPVNHFMGRALVYRHERKTVTIEIADLELCAADLQRDDYLLLATGWDRYWGDSRYFSGFPTLSPEAARWLLQFSLKGIGLDTISADPVDAADLSVHQILLGQGMVIVENLTNLMTLPASHCLFSCLPLALPDADGSPVRAVAVLDEIAVV